MKAKMTKILMVSSTVMIASTMTGWAQAKADAPVATSLAKGQTEQRILKVLEDLDRNQRKGNMNVPLEDGRLLRIFVESLGAKHVVEIGTSNGYSGIWFCLALQ